MAAKFKPWDAARHVKTEEDAHLLLQACFEEDEGDGSLVHWGLNTVIRSGNTSQIAQNAGLNRAGLYPTFAEGGNPSFATVVKVLGALGLRLRVEEFQVDNGKLEKPEVVGE